MRPILLAVGLAAAAALAPTPSFAAGCLSGAVVGGTVGHFAGHHGLLGAGAGCVVGHHEATENRRAQEQQARQYNSGGPGFSDRDDGYRR